MLSQNDTTKTCSRCGIEKPLYEFHKSRSEKDGYKRLCKQCRAETEGHRYVKPAPPGFQWCRKCDTLYPATREYFYWNSTQNRLYASCKSCHYARTRNWQRNNWEFWLGLNRQWAIAHPDKIILSQHNWKQNHPDTYRASIVRGIQRAIEWKQAHPEQAKAIAKKGKAKRRATEYNAPGSHTAADIRLQIAAQTDKRGCLHCWWCGCKIEGSYHLDHKHPLAKGGSNGADNLVISCPVCNLSKNSKTPAEWAGRLL
jgi:5-methylcytosine-specific restriction endonuclease McrA